MSAGASIRSNRNSPSVAGFVVKLCFGLLGAGCALAGGLVLHAHLLSGLTGERAEATVLGRRSSCVLEYQLANESDPRRERMACDKAEAAVAANPGRHIKVERLDYVRLQFPLANGRMHETEVKTGFGSTLPPSVGIGGTVTIHHAGREPFDVRIAAPLSSLIDYMFLSVFGVVVLLLTLFGSSGGSRYRPSKSLAQALAAPPAGSPERERNPQVGIRRGEPARRAV